MITRDEWAAMRDAYFRTRSITATAHLCNVSRKCVARYLCCGGNGYPPIKDVIAVAENEDIARFMIATKNMSDGILAVAETLQLSPRGKKRKDGSVVVDSSEYARVQKIMREAIEMKSRLDELNDGAIVNADVDEPQRKYLPDRPHGESEADRLRRESLEYWVGLEKHFLSKEQMQLDSITRAKLLSNIVLLKIARESKERIAASMTNPTKNVSAVSVKG